MKVHTEPSPDPGFQPIDFKITIETLDELKFWSAVAESHEPSLVEKNWPADFGDIDESVLPDLMPLWEFLQSELRKRDLEPY